jgi:hypothetical protein
MFSYKFIKGCSKVLVQALGIANIVHRGEGVWLSIQGHEHVLWNQELEPGQTWFQNDQAY